MRRNFTTIGAADIFEDRMSRDSLFDYWPLQRQIEQNVTGKLLTEIAAQHARGRRLLIATTNLDAGRRVVWNMGAIAARGDEKALKLFRAILLASCSIPGFFSPVGDRGRGERQKAQGDAQRRHADRAVLRRPGIDVLGPRHLTAAVQRALCDRELQARARIHHADRSIAGVLGRSIAVALTQALRAELMLVHAGTQRHGIGLRVAHVDAAFNHPSRGPFDGKYMQALYEFGVAAGKNGTAFEDALPDV